MAMMKYLNTIQMCCYFLVSWGNLPSQNWHLKLPNLITVNIINYCNHFSKISFKVFYIIRIRILWYHYALSHSGHIMRLLMFIDLEKQTWVFKNHIPLRSSSPSYSYFLLLFRSSDDLKLSFCLPSHLII